MKSTWTIRQMFLWVFIVALTLPYIVAMIPKQASTLDASLLNVKTLDEWLSEIDPSVTVANDTHGVSSASYDLVESELNYKITMKNANAHELFMHLEKRLFNQIQKHYSQCSTYSIGNESFSCVVSDEHTRRHLYAWNLTPHKSNFAVANDASENSMRIKVLQIVYQIR